MKSSRYLFPAIICSIIGIVGHLAHTHLSNNNKFSAIINKLGRLDFPQKDEDLRQSFIEQIKSIYSHNNPEIDASIKYVWVLSARHSYDKMAVLSSPQNAQAFDRNDGYDRINLGIEIAQQVTAKKVGRSIYALTCDDYIAHAPVIIYNGEKEGNDVLKGVLAKGGIIRYPKEKFRIFDLHKSQAHTKGQFNSLKQESDRGEITLAHATMAIITHAYHWPRVSRTFGHINEFNWFGSSTKLIAYLVDRQFQALGTEIELQLEIKKLPSYVEKGFILRESSASTPYNGAIRS